MDRFLFKCSSLVVHLIIALYALKSRSKLTGVTQDMFYRCKDTAIILKLK